MIVNKDPEYDRRRANEEKLKISDDEHKDKLLGELRKESVSIICLAWMYAKNFEALGFDVTERWVTAEQQGEAVEKIYRKGYTDGILKGREIEGEAIRKRLEIQKSRQANVEFDYLDRYVGENNVSGALRNVVQPTDGQHRRNCTKKRRKRK